MNRLLIVDGHAYAYRAFYAIRDLCGPDGRPTNAIYGFVKMFEKMRVGIMPSHIVVVWDGGLSASRLATLPEYKAQRPEMPPDLRLQLGEIESYLKASRVASLCQMGVEADDIIGSLSRQAVASHWSVVIASSDKDFMQLVSDRVGLLNPNDKTGEVWQRNQVVAKSGVEPAQVADWLALMGDAVDNIPGVPGIGSKTAAELLKQFGSIKTLLARLDEVKSMRLRSVLTDYASVLERNLGLVQLQIVACNLSLEQLVLKLPDSAQLRTLYQAWGFSGLIKTLDEKNSEQQAELI